MAWASPALAAMVLAAVACFTQVRTFPGDATVGIDSGVFAYGGEQVLLGKLPYADFWDHKPPVVFYLNALGISLLGPTAYGLWAFGALYTILTTLTMAAVLRRPLGLGPATLAAAIMVLTLTHRNYFAYANLTEVYALLPQVLTLAAGCAFARTRQRHGLLLLGILTSICFLTRQTAVGLGMAVFFAAVAEASSGSFLRRACGLGVWFATGFVLPLGVVAAYWASRGAGAELWAATIEFNRLYAGNLLSAKKVYGTVRFFLLSRPLASLGLMASVGATMFTIARCHAVRLCLGAGIGDSGEFWSTKSLPPERRLLLHTAFLALPIEIFLASPGVGAEHYYITAIPALALAATFLLVEAIRQARRELRPTFWALLGVSSLVALAVPWTLETYSQVRPGVQDALRLASGWRERQLGLPPELEYVVQNTTRSQSVLFWGYWTRANFATGRRSPTRYTYPAALLTPGYDNTRRWREFLADLERDPPALILGDPGWTPHFLPNENGVCPDCAPGIREGMEAFSAYVLEHYEVETEINRLQILVPKAE